MLTCGVWVKRGIAKEVPDKVELNEDDLKELLEETKEKIKEVENSDGLDLDNEQENIFLAKSEPQDENNETKIDDHQDSDDEICQEYGLDNYDEEGTMMDGAGIAGLMYYQSNGEDPYIKLKDLEDEEKEDFLIKKDDNLFVVGKMEEDYSCLEVYVYNEEEESCYVHHDIIIDSFPLCLEWLSFDPSLDGQSGNYVAVGSMEPDIQVWDLDIVDVVEPAFTLFGRKKKKKKKKKVNISEKDTKGHTDAVLSISWNHNVTNVLASGSADNTVLLWDLSQCSCVHTLSHHSDKVQSIQWHPFETQSLLSGSFDKTAKLLDCRSPDISKSWSLSGECEQVLWDKLSPYNFFVSSDDGIICYCDARTDKAVFTLNAHDGPVAGMSLSSQLEGCLTTVSSDRQFKVWDYQNGTPKTILSRDMKMGTLNFVTGCPDISMTFAMGGQKDGVRMLNLLDTTQGAQYYSQRGVKNIVKKEVKDKELKVEPVDKDEEMDCGNDASQAMAELSIKTENVTYDDKPIIKRKKKKKKK